MSSWNGVDTRRNVKHRVSRDVDAHAKVSKYRLPQILRNSFLPVQEDGGCAAFDPYGQLDLAVRRCIFRRASSGHAGHFQAKKVSRRRPLRIACKKRGQIRLDQLLLPRLSSGALSDEV
jgi:hypothetical protein